MAPPALARLLAPLLLLLAPGCQSESTDIVATYKTYIGQRVIEAGANGWGRAEERRPGGVEPDRYTLTTPEGRNLVVTREKDGWMVADAIDHLLWAQRHWQPPKLPEPKGRFVESGSQKVGGWTGTGYRMSTGYCGSWTRFVVLREPGLEAFGRMLRRNLLHGAKERGASACEIQAIELMGQGVLLWVDDPEVTLEKLERRSVDPARFRPPSRILSRAELFRRLEADSPSPVIVAPTRQDPPR